MARKSRKTQETQDTPDTQEPSASTTQENPTMSETTESTTESTTETLTDSKIKVSGLIFSFPQPYSEGHVLTAVEASVLNQTYGENLRNNFAPRVDAFRKALPEGTEITQDHIDELQAKFTEYASGYTFAARGTRLPVDPVQREAERLASAAIRGALSAKNIAVKDLAKGKMEELVANLLARNPAYMEEARKRIDAAKSLASSTLESFDL